MTTPQPSDKTWMSETIWQMEYGEMEYEVHSLICRVPILTKPLGVNPSLWETKGMENLVTSQGNHQNVGYSADNLFVFFKKSTQ